MAEYRVFVAKLNTSKDADLIAYLESIPSFVDWVRQHAGESIRQVGAGVIAPTCVQEDGAPDLAAFAHIVRATLVSVFDEKMKGALLTTTGTDDADLDSELGDKFDAMEFGNDNNANTDK